VGRRVSNARKKREFFLAWYHEVLSYKIKRRLGHWESEKPIFQDV
jgi:hypothetical protein